MKRSSHTTKEDKRQALRVARLKAAKWAESNLNCCDELNESSINVSKLNTRSLKKERENNIAFAFHRAYNNTGAKKSLIKNVAKGWFVHDILKLLLIFLFGVVIGYLFSEIELTTIVNYSWKLVHILDFRNT